MTQKKHPTPPQIISNNVVAKSRLFTVESLELKFSNDEERQYERIRGGGRGAVMIVPITADNEMLLVREYCAGTNDYQLGFPKGVLMGYKELDACLAFGVGRVPRVTG